MTALWLDVGLGKARVEGGEAALDGSVDSQASLQFRVDPQGRLLRGEGMKDGLYLGEHAMT